MDHLQLNLVLDTGQIRITPGTEHVVVDLLTPRIDRLNVVGKRDVPESGAFDRASLVFVDQ